MDYIKNEKEVINIKSRNKYANFFLYSEKDPHSVETVAILVLLRISKEISCTAIIFWSYASAN